MLCKVTFSKSAVKNLSKLDKQTARLIKNWVVKNLVDTDNPKLYGKELTGNLTGVYRYKVGDYRLFAEIKNQALIILIFDLAHHRDIYKQKP